MNYSNDVSSVRVDFFKESGKWYTTEAIQWIGPFESGLIHDGFAASLKAHLNGRLGGMWAVCLEPYHQHSHPIMMRVPE